MIFSPKIIHLGITEYEDVLLKMQEFTLKRNIDSIDEIWLTEHYPVYTQGQAGKQEHVLNKNNIPIVQSDRGGQVTYHGIGQAIMYPLIDIKRAKIGVRELVTTLEQAVVELITSFEHEAYTKPDAPGVYISKKKIASLGLRIKNNSSYHGIALNVDMDLSPFLSINPCGFSGLEMTQCKDLGVTHSTTELLDLLVNIFIKKVNNRNLQ